MEVVFHSAGPVGVPLKKRAEARLRFMLRHLWWFVARAIVRLSEQSDAAGRAAKRCFVELKAADGSKVVASATAHEWLDSIDHALSRAARLLARYHRHAHGG